MEKMPVGACHPGDRFVREAEKNPIFYIRLLRNDPGIKQSNDSSDIPVLALGPLFPYIILMNEEELVYVNKPYL